MKFPIYMDSHATTPVDPRVLQAMLPFFTERFGNAASIDHAYGAEAAEAVENARKQLARCINARPEDIIFTSGATESDNLAIIGLANRQSDKGNQIITCTTEHKAVLDACSHLEKTGERVKYIPVDRFGVIDLEKLVNAIDDRTVLISVMAANNEVGTIAPIKEIGDIAHRHGLLFHTDAAQAAGHIHIDVEETKTDLMSLSAHKMYGPKGIGALYVRQRNLGAKPSPIIFGGGHEQGLRSGTLNVPGIVGFGKAFEIAVKEMKRETERHAGWTAKMLEALRGNLHGVELNGHPRQRLTHNLNLAIDGIDNKALVKAVSRELAISTGSACTSLKVEPSHVILALGYDEKRAHSSIRIGLSRFNTEEEVEYATKLLVNTVNMLRRISGSSV